MKTSTGYARISRLARMMTAGELLPIEGRNMSEGGVEALNPEQLERLASYFDEEVISAKNYKNPRTKVQCLATG
jgi:hypothetical protein